MPRFIVVFASLSHIYAYAHTQHTVSIFSEQTAADKNDSIVFLANATFVYGIDESAFQTFPVASFICAYKIVFKNHLRVSYIHHDKPFQFFSFSQWRTIDILHSKVSLILTFNYQVSAAQSKKIAAVYFKINSNHVSPSVHPTAAM